MDRQMGVRFMPGESRSRSILSLVWVAGLLLCVAAARWQQHDLDEQVAQRLEELSDQVGQDIEQRMRRYEMGLKGARDAVIGAGGAGINRQRFRAYGQAHDFLQEFPGARGIAFARRVQPRDEAAFVAAARRDGWPQFQIRQIQAHAGERMVIQYAEPEADNVKGVGLDVMSEANRREAVWRAIRTGQVSMTAPIHLLDDNLQQIQSVLLLLPVYTSGARLDSVPARENAALGVIVAPVELSPVLKDIETAQSEFALTLYDRSPLDTLTLLHLSIFTSHEGQGQHMHMRRLNIFGLEWQLELRARPLLLAHLTPVQPLPLLLLSIAGWSLLCLLIRLRLQSIDQARQLGRQQARMAAIVDSSTDGMIVQTLDGVITDWNPGAERMLGYSAHEAVGRTMAELVVPPEYQLQEAQLLRKVALGEATPSIDKVQRTKSGQLLPVTMSMVPLRDDKGLVIGLARVVRDISVRKAAEQRVLELNAALTQRVQNQSAELELVSARERLLLENAMSSVIVTDARGQILLFNPAAERLLGYAAHEVIGRVDIHTFHDQDELRVRTRSLRQRLGRELAPGEIFLNHLRSVDGDNNEWKYVHRDGSRIPVLLTVGALRNDAGVLQGFIGIAVNLTERNRLEAELRRASELAARTEWAENASAAKTLFLAHMSHEIRTPLNAVIALNYLLLRSPLNPEQRSLAQKTRQTGQTLLAIVNNVLDLSKIEADEMALDIQPFNLAQNLQQALAVVESEAQRKSLPLRLDLPAELPLAVRGDAPRLRQVLINLLNNAIKFTSAGEVVLQLRCWPQDGDRVGLRIEVQDSGIGIAAQDQARLFQPYIQAESTASWRQGGTGLGLSIAQRLVQMMGGVIDLHSTLGQGSTFGFGLSLPLASAAEAESLRESLRENSEAPAAPLGQRLSGVRVLMVDDSSINLEVGQCVLALEGAQVALASNGQQAVDHLARHATDVVLMDMQMPVLDGCAAARTIREKLGLTELPIIALTAVALNSERERALQAGMRDFLCKPVDPEALIMMVRRHARPGAPATASNTGAAPDPAVPADWPDIVGLNRAQSLRQMGGDLALMRRMLQLFVDSYGTLADELQVLARTRTRISAERRRYLTRQVHKLQGNVAILGLDALKAVALRVQHAWQALPASEQPLLPDGAELAATLQATLGHARAWLAQAPQAALAADAASNPAPAVLAANAPELAQLCELLQHQDFAAIALYTRLQPGLDALLSAPERERLQAAMQILDTAQALDVLRAFQARQPKA